jgi:hypothetical protein
MWNSITFLLLFGYAYVMCNYIYLHLGIQVAVFYVRERIFTNLSWMKYVHFIFHVVLNMFLYCSLKIYHTYLSKSKHLHYFVTHLGKMEHS